MRNGGSNLEEDPLADLNPPSSTTRSLDPESLSRYYNLRSPAVKRILREASEMAEQERTILHACPLEDNIFEWHFTLRGAPDTAYEKGVYHGRLILPTQYPMSPPEIMLLTPSGRFETGTKICLSISSYHPETWQPSWSIRTALMALRSFMGSNSPGAIGSVECSDAVRINLASTSAKFICADCGIVGNILEPEVVATEEDNVNKGAGETESSLVTPTKPLPALLLNHQSKDKGESFGVDKSIPKPEDPTRTDRLPTVEEGSSAAGPSAPPPVVVVVVPSQPSIRADLYDKAIAIILFLIAAILLNRLFG